MIRALLEAPVEAVMTIHKIGPFQVGQPRLPMNKGGDSFPEVQGESIIHFLKTIKTRFRLKRLKSSKRIKKSKRLKQPNKNTKGLQMTKMNNLRYEAALVTKLQKIPRGKTRLYGRENNLNRRENRLRKGCPFGSGSKTSSTNMAGHYKPWFWLSAWFLALLPLLV